MTLNKMYEVRYTTIDQDFTMTVVADNLQQIGDSVILVDNATVDIGNNIVYIEMVEDFCEDKQ